MENSHIYVSDSDRQYILAKDDIIKISKLYGSRLLSQQVRQHQL